MPQPQLEFLHIAIELKVARPTYGHAELIDPTESQLWEKYMRPEGCRYGAFVVLWFRDDKRCHGPREWPAIADLRTAVREKAAEIESRRNVTLATYVIDMTTLPRRR